MRNALIILYFFASAVASGSPVKLPEAIQVSQMFFNGRGGGEGDFLLRQYQTLKQGFENEGYVLLKTPPELKYPGLLSSAYNFDFILTYVFFKTDHKSNQNYFAQVSIKGILKYGKPSTILRYSAGYSDEEIRMILEKNFNNDDRERLLEVNPEFVEVYQNRIIPKQPGKSSWGG